MIVQQLATFYQKGTHDVMITMNVSQRPVIYGKVDIQIKICNMFIQISRTIRDFAIFGSKYFVAMASKVGSAFIPVLLKSKVC